MNNYNTEIISVGTELLLGRVLNTDSRDISRMLSKIGINVRYHTVVGDNPQRLEDCINVAKSRADIIITTGGLGPTVDDLTKQILAKAFGLELVEDKTERDKMYDYIKGGKKLTPNNYIQAMVPQGCTVFHNQWGTAPGCAFEKDGKVVIMVPGPPKECGPMFENCVIPYLQKFSQEKIVSHSVNIFGLAESAVDNIFGHEMEHMHNPSMAPYANECDCFLQVTAKAETEEKAELLVDTVLMYADGKLGDYVYGFDYQCIEQRVFDLLKDKGMTFAAAESCTGGDIARRITDIPGASAIFKGGVVSYTNEVKAGLLGIDPEIIEKNSAVSAEVAKLMAENVKKLTGADIGVSITGVAGPESDGIHKVGDVFVAMAADKTYVKELHLGDYRTRSFVRRMSGNYLFDMMRRYLTDIDVLGALD